MENKNELKLSGANRLALYFSKQIDSNLALYISLKDFHKYGRYFLYFFLMVTVPSAVFFISKFLIEFNTFDLSNEMKQFLYLLLNVSTIFVFFMTSLIVFYESIITNNLDFKQLKTREREIKKQKSSFIKLWMRLLLYFFLLLVILSLTSSFYDLLFPFIFMILFIIYIEIKIKNL